MVMFDRSDSAVDIFPDPMGKDGIIKAGMHFDGDVTVWIRWKRNIRIPKQFGRNIPIF